MASDNGEAISFRMIYEELSKYVTPFPARASDMLAMIPGGSRNAIVSRPFF
jgi:hypothetical protein